MANLHSSFFKQLFCSVLLTGLVTNNLHAGVLDIAGSAIRNTPWLTVGTAKGLYSGLKFIGRGNALEGAADIVVAGVVINVALALKHRYFGSGLKCSERSLNAIQEEFGELDNNQTLPAGIKIKNLEKLRDELGKYVTVGSSFGVSSNSLPPFMIPNRFYVQLDRIQKQLPNRKSSGASTALDIPGKLRELSQEDMGKIDPAVQKHLGAWWKTLWPYLFLKPSYFVAADLYWKITAAINRLNNAAKNNAGLGQAVMVNNFNCPPFNPELLQGRFPVQNS
ncbi:hypothetical protein KJZ61_04575 [Candidatus Dependentiae bacterium]|nr:hypothetical protein [Candidatus Dependentiae bacterium]